MRKGPMLVACWYFLAAPVWAETSSDDVEALRRQVRQLTETVQQLKDTSQA